MAIDHKITPERVMPRTNLPSTDCGQLQLGGEGRWQLAVVYRGRHCPPCKKYLKKLDGLLEEFRGMGAEIIAVSGDPSERAAEKATEEG
jgi:peroxiredoxin